MHEIWKPFAQADMPAERWPEIEHAVERLRPVASEALMAIFQRRLSGQIEGAFDEITRRVAERTTERTATNDRADPIPTPCATRCSSAGRAPRPGGGKRAQRMREFGMPVSTWMIEQLALQPGQRVLELAAGPGDTGFLAAELIAPAGR